MLQNICIWVQVLNDNGILYVLRIYGLNTTSSPPLFILKINKFVPAIK